MLLFIVGDQLLGQQTIAHDLHLPDVALEKGLKWRKSRNAPPLFNMVKATVRKKLAVPLASPHLPITTSSYKGISKAKNQIF